MFYSYNCYKIGKLCYLEWRRKLFYVCRFLLVGKKLKKIFELLYVLDWFVYCEIVM